MLKRFVIGDIHGCIRTFRKLIEETILPSKKDKVYLLGDYIDRGPDSKAVIDYILELQQKSYQVITLMGNHEHMLNQAQNSVSFFNLWMINSGFTTLRDFGIPSETYYSPKSILRIPEKYLEFFHKLSFYEQIEGFFLSHGCFDGKTDNPLDDIDSMIWGRKYSYNAGFLEDRILIHGHTPVSYSDIRKSVDDRRSKVINLDGGCVYKNNRSLGNLLALELDSWNLFCVKNSET
jgi:serine/threonine protein phosphatase 1